MKIKYLAVVLIIVLALGCVACNNDGENSTTTESAKFYETDSLTYIIDNPVCPLQYSAQWKDIVETTVTVQSDECIVDFVADLDDKSIPVFSIVFCNNSDEGSLLGALKVDDGEKNVYLIDLYDDEMASSLSEEALEKYQAMYEDINVIISKLIYENGMTLG